MTAAIVSWGSGHVSVDVLQVFLLVLAVFGAVGCGLAFWALLIGARS